MSLLLLQSVLATDSHHLSPFLMLGDPTPELSLELCRALVAAGASMLELGMPYADPSADGPAVQAAGRRARASGVSTERALEQLGRVRAACPATPLNLLVYGNLVHARGFDRFARDAVRAGASSLLVPDVPLEEGAPLRAACRAHGLGVVMLAGPRTPASRLLLLAAASDAFVYLAGHQGVTGAVGGALDERRSLIARVATQLTTGAPSVPLCVGFGLRSCDDVASVHAAGARIAVVGSHLLRVLERALAAATGDHAAVPEQLAHAFQQLMPANHRSKETKSCS